MLAEYFDTAEHAAYNEHMANVYMCVLLGIFVLIIIPLFVHAYFKDKKK